jgi:hypothetical protein
VLALIIIGIAVQKALPATAAQDDARSDPTNQPRSAGESETPDYNGLDLTRPQQNAELRLQYRTSSSPTSETDQEQAFLKLATKVQLPDSWKLGLQGQIPFFDKATTNLSTSNVDREAGVGDAFAQAVLAQTIDAHWAYGFGVRLVAQTAEDSLGSGKWQIMPAFGVRYSFLEINPNTYFVPSIRYALSFAGDPTRRSISQPQIAPTLNIGLSDHWFVTLYPSNDIRINYGDASPARPVVYFFHSTRRLAENLGTGSPLLSRSACLLSKTFRCINLRASYASGYSFNVPSPGETAGRPDDAVIEPHHKGK